MTSRNRSKTLLTLAAVAMAAIVFTSVSANAAPLASFNFGNGGGGQTGEPVNADGLILPGWVGPWTGISAGGTNNVQEQATSGAYTFTWNVGGAETKSGWASGALRNGFAYTNNPSRWSGDVPFEISGLDAGSTYDLIMFGTGRANDNSTAEFYIPGHDGGNGVGNPVTLDSEGDGNFLAVEADGSGKISGFMANQGGEARLTGIQFEEFIAPVAPAVPEPASIAIWSLMGLCLAGYGYRRGRRNS